MNALQAAARTYAAQGASIFPLLPRSKEPYPYTNGFRDARADASPWDDGIPHNIGFLPASRGLVCIDVDQPQHWQEATAWGLLAEPTFEVHTGKGSHFYFRGQAPTNGAPVGSLIVRAAYGYTILPPSVHPSGATYETDGTFADAIPLPPRFAAHLATLSSAEGGRDRVRKVFSGRRIAEGERHPTLCTLAGHLAARGVDEAFGLELVHAWNAQYCDPPKGAPEVTKLVSDIYAKERAKCAQVADGLLLNKTFVAAAVVTTPQRFATRRETPAEIRRRILGGRR